MQAPSFWYRSSSLAANLLRPFACLYGFGAWVARQIAARTKVAVPVICIGNCVVGGAGKTPIVADFAKRLRARKIDVHILSRGYGGMLYGPVRADIGKYQAYDVGDEPLLLADVAPVWVAKNKVAGAVAAVTDNAQMLLLDDGLQNHSLHKDASFLVIDGATGIGNGLLLPAGPLREPLDAALKRVKAVIWLGDRTDFYASLATRLKAENIPLLVAQTRTIATNRTLRGMRSFAFSGIGHPEKFFKGLGETGAEIVQTRAYPDHFMWGREEVEDLIDQARRADALPTTTAKDAMRLPEDLRKQVVICDVELKWDDEAALDALLSEILRANPPRDHEGL